MPTLHIEHSITDYDTWRTAFGTYADARERAGVRRHRVQQPVDDSHFIVIDLDFDTTDEATGFLGFLRNRVWSGAQNALGVGGTPQARILEPVDER